MGIMQQVSDLLFGAKHAEFVSDFSLEESVARLSGMAVNWGEALLRPESLMGRATQEDVSLSRVINQGWPIFRTIYFEGRFVQDGHSVRLVGKFSLSRKYRAFSIIWFSFFLLLALFALLSSLQKHGVVESLLLATIFLLFPIAYLIGIRLNLWLTRQDIPWLSSLIHEALQREA